MGLCDWATSYRETRDVRVYLGWSRILWRFLCSLGILAYISFRLFRDDDFIVYAPNGQTAVSPILAGNITTLFTKEDLENIPVKHLDLYNKYWDAQDSIYNIRESSFFVATNMIITPNQRRCVCQPDCNTTAIDCCKKTRQSFKDSRSTTWCPPEREELPSTTNAVFRDSLNLTVLLKNSVYFPKFDVSIATRNETTNNTFTIEDIVKKALTEPGAKAKVNAHTDAKAVENILLHGAVIKIEINRNCVLRPWYRILGSEYAQTWLMENCKPHYDVVLIKEDWEVKNNHYFQRDKDTDKFSRYLYTYRGIAFKIDFLNKIGEWDLMTIILNLMGGFAIFTSLEWVFKYVASGFCCSSWLAEATFCCGWRWFPSDRSAFRQFNNVYYESIKVTIEPTNSAFVARLWSGCQQMVARGSPTTAPASASEAPVLGGRLPGMISPGKATWRWSP